MHVPNIWKTANENHGLRDLDCAVSIGIVENGVTINTYQHISRRLEPGEGKYKSRAAP